MRRYKKRNRERMNQIIMGLFLAFLMVFSVVGYVINYRDPALQGKQEFTYNNQKYEVDIQTNFLTTKLDGQTLTFYNYPDAVTPLPKEAVSDLLAANAPGPILTFDPTIGQYMQIIDLTRSELDEYFLQKGIFLAHGIHKSTTGPYANFPRIDCENATKGSPVIKFINSSRSNIEYKDYCLEISSNGLGILESRDSIMYSLYGLI